MVGKDHHYTVQSYNNVGFVMQVMGDFVGAFKQMSEESFVTASLDISTTQVLSLKYRDFSDRRINRISISITTPPFTKETSK